METENLSSKNNDWVVLEYIGESYEVTEGVQFKKGFKSGLPKDIWENIKNNESMKNWKLCESL